MVRGHGRDLDVDHPTATPIFQNGDRVDMVVLMQSLFGLTFMIHLSMADIVHDLSDQS